jgi:hypothetical protein
MLPGRRGRAAPAVARRGARPGGQGRRNVIGAGVATSPHCPSSLSRRLARHPAGRVVSGRARARPVAVFGSGRACAIALPLRVTVRAEARAVPAGSRPAPKGGAVSRPGSEPPAEPSVLSRIRSGPQPKLAVLFRGSRFATRRTSPQPRVRRRPWKAEPSGTVRRRSRSRPKRNFGPSRSRAASSRSPTASTGLFRLAAPRESPCASSPKARRWHADRSPCVTAAPFRLVAGANPGSLAGRSGPGSLRSGSFPASEVRVAKAGAPAPRSPGMSVEAEASSRSRRPPVREQAPIPAASVAPVPKPGRSRSLSFRHRNAFRSAGRLRIGPKPFPKPPLRVPSRKRRTPSVPVPTAPAEGRFPRPSRLGRAQAPRSLAICPGGFPVSCPHRLSPPHARLPSAALPLHPLL